MYQIEEQASPQDIEMRAYSDEAVQRFQMGEFQGIKTVIIQKPQENAKDDKDNNNNFGNNFGNSLKRGKHSLGKYQGRHRASIVGTTTTNTLEVQPASPSSKKTSGRKSSKRTGDIRTVLRYPGRRDSIY